MVLRQRTKHLSFPAAYESWRLQVCHGSTVATRQVRCPERRIEGTRDVPISIGSRRSQMVDRLSRSVPTIEASFCQDPGFGRVAAEPLVEGIRLLVARV